MSAIAATSTEQRAMLRDAVRGFLARHWVRSEGESIAEPAALTAIWRGLCGQGIAVLGSDHEAGGLGDILVVMHELGRAACPAPMLSAVLANVSLSHRSQAASLLDAIHAGEAVPAFSFGPLDSDRGRGPLAVSQGRVSGELRFVEAGVVATHLLTLTGDGAVAVIAAAGDGVDVAPTRAMGADGLALVTLDAAAVETFETAHPADDLRQIARLCQASRACGAVERGFELAVDWAKERKQFGQPIGRFQAVQHKLVNNLMALEAVRLSLENAADHYDRQVDIWRIFAAGAFACASGMLRKTALENHHAMGAIGYAEAHELPALTELAHLDLVGHGGVRRAHQELADYFIGDEPHGLPEHDLGKAGNAFRAEVRQWLADNWVGARKDAFDAQSPYKKREFDPGFARDLGKAGYISMGWAKRFGGQERTPAEQLAFIEEIERVEAPRAGASVQAATIMVFGTPEQQATLLPEIASGEVIYGMGYSEPNSGSDLASLRTRAVRDGDEWVINGQKIWTTTYWGEYMLLATRTDPEAVPQHAGLTMFIVPMDTPGITIKPMTTMYDGAFANVFYDDVRVPDSARIGEVNEGWKVLTGALGSERGYIGAGIIAKVGHDFDVLCDYIRQAEADGQPLAADPWVRDRIGQLAAEIEAGRLMTLRCVEMIDQAVTPPHYAAMTKVYSGELMERFGETALDILGMEATLSEGSPGAILRGRLEQKLRHSLMWVISVGTNEIQRNLIAIRGLGLPR